MRNIIQYIVAKRIGLYCFLLFIFSTLLSCSVKNDKPGKLENSKLIVDDKKKEIEQRKGDYNVLCQMGVNPWGKLELFLSSMKGEYYDKLKAVLLENGYCIEDFWNIKNAMGMRTVLKEDVYRDTCLVEWNECNIAWLYIGFREAGEFTGTFLDFKQSMKTKEGFLIYYNKSLELGIVDNWEAFLRMMIEPNEEKCIEWYWDDFLEELREYDEQIQNYYEEVQEYDREYYEEMQYSHH